jgi:SAM-dependent methyltransferase
MRSDKADRNSYGTSNLSLIDRFGTWLSRGVIRRSIGERSGLKVLEIGCGYQAKNLLAIQDRATAMVGCDFNIAPEVKRLKGFEAIEQPAEIALPTLKDRSFDVVMLISVLEHLSDPLGMLSACSQMLAPGGRLLVNVPTWRGKYFLELTAFRLGLSPNGKIEMDDHKMYYDKRDLWPLLVKAGFAPGRIHLHYHKFGLNLFAVADNP